MLPQFYQACLGYYLSKSQILTLEILIWLLQVHKQVKIERLAACFPLPILYESRRRHIQRFLTLPFLSIPLIWFPLIKYILRTKFSPESRVIVALDRTQWQTKNLLMVSVIWHKRALPIYWQFLEKRGSSNLAEQIAVLRPVLRLLKCYEIVIVGDREFRSVELADWLKHKKVYFALRQKQDTYMSQPGQTERKLSEIGLAPGIKLFLTGVNYTKKKGFERVSLAAYWPRKYRGKLEKEGWYILTNLNSLEEAVKVYKARSGIEALFKDCKTGGYNLEGSQASIARLTRLVLLIAIAYTWATLKGASTRRQGQQQYVSRLQEVKRREKRHSNFWIGLYGFMWTIGWEFCRLMVERLMRLSLHKLKYFQQGLRAMFLMTLAS
jgi:hypothetical protein